MGINVIDWTQAKAAVAAMEDGAAKEIATNLLPVAQAAIQTLSDHIQDRLDATLGNALSDITAERTEAVKQVFAELHGALDRIGGAALTLPPQKT